LVHGKYMQAGRSGKCARDLCSVRDGYTLKVVLSRYVSLPVISGGLVEDGRG
jgi:hypothetical protein